MTISVFAFVPQMTSSFRLQGAHSGIDVYFDTVEIDDNKLILRLDYESYGEFFEIIRPITVALDREFTQELELLYGHFYREGRHEYSFKLDGYYQLDELYVRLPILYMPIEIEVITLKGIPRIGLVIPDPFDTYSIWLEGERTSVWLEGERTSIHDVWDDDKTHLLYHEVLIQFKPHTQTLPNTPILVVDGETHYGLSKQWFDSDGNFFRGAFVFRVPPFLPLPFEPIDTSGMPYEEQFEYIRKIHTARMDVACRAG